MQALSRRVGRSAVIGIVFAALTLGGAPTAFGDDWARDRSAATAVRELDPAIRTAMIAYTAETPATPVVVTAAPVTATNDFAWGAAALGLGVGIATVCLLLGCVTLVRGHGRLRSV